MATNRHEMVDEVGIILVHKEANHKVVFPSNSFLPALTMRCPNTSGDFNRTVVTWAVRET